MFRLVWWTTYEEESANLNEETNDLRIRVKVEILKTKVSLTRRLNSLADQYNPNLRYTIKKYDS